MKDFINKLYRNHSLIYKGLLFICTTFLIVYLFPKSGKFKYNFEKGKPWQSENLYAPFDFAILKSDKQLEIERAEIVKQSPFFFQYSDSISSLAVSQLTSSNQWDSLKMDTNRLAKLFEIGIVQTNSLEEEPSENTLIVVQKEGHYEEIEFGELLSIQEAASEIRNDSGLAPASKELIVNSLQQNVIYNFSKTNAVLEQKLNSLLRTHGKIEKSELIVAKGELVNEEVYWKLNSLKSEFEHSKADELSNLFVIIGKTILVFIIFA